MFYCCKGGFSLHPKPSPVFSIITLLTLINFYQWVGESNVNGIYCGHQCFLFSCIPNNLLFSSLTKPSLSPPNNPPAPPPPSAEPSLSTPSVFLTPNQLHRLLLLPLLLLHPLLSLLPLRRTHHCMGGVMQLRWYVSGSLIPPPDLPLPFLFPK